MFEKQIEISVGIFIFAGILALLVLAFKVSGLSTGWGQPGYLVTASFDNIGDLKPRAAVTLSGVRVGEVSAIHLNKDTFKAEVTLRLDAEQTNLPADTTASIYTAGLLGSNYISLTPGFESETLRNGSKIINTHPAIVLENLIGQLMFKVGHSNATK